MQIPFTQKTFLTYRCAFEHFHLYLRVSFFLLYFFAFLFVLFPHFFLSLHSSRLEHTQISIFQLAKRA